MLKINGQPFSDEEFKNNEAVYKKPVLYKDINIITMMFEDNKDVAHLAIANSFLNFHLSNKHNLKEKTTNRFNEENLPTSTDKVEKTNCYGQFKTKKVLLMPYIPYSRMDREIDDQIFSLKYFADVLNDMKFDKVIVADPHSKVSYDLIKNLEEVNIENLITNEVLSKINVDFIMFPDKGAKEKYTQKYLNLCAEYKIVYGEKKRDFKNRGKIKEYSIIADDMDLKGKSVLIIDDLCSFGNTFKYASFSLKTQGVDKIYLFVTHTENTVFQGELLDFSDIEKVFTTNSIIRNQSHPKLSVIDIF